MPHDAHGLARDALGTGDVGGLVVHEHDVGSLDGGVRTHGAHRDAHVGTGEHRRVVDAVAHKGELALIAFAGEQRLHAFDLVGGKKLRMVLVEPELAGHVGRDLLAVAREHDGAVYAHLVKRAHGLGRIGLDGVGDHDMPGVGAVDRHMKDGAHRAARRCGNSRLFQHSCVSDQHLFAVDHGSNTVTCGVLRLAHAGGNELARMGRTDGLRDRVVGEALCQRGDLDKALRAVAPCGLDLHNLKGAVGEGASLVKDNGVYLGQGLKVVRALDQYADFRGAADAAEEGERHADDQRAGAGDNEEGEAAQDPVGPSTGHDASAEREQHGRTRDGRRVHAGEARDEVLGPRLLLAGVFDQLEDTAHRRLAKRLDCAHVHDAGQVDASGDDLVAALHMARDRFAGERRGVELRGAIDDDAVDGHALAGLDHDGAADLDVIGIDLLKVTVCSLDVGVVGRDVHHGRDGLAALAHGVGLEELAHLVEEHDRGALGHVRLGVREEDHRKGTERRHHHEEALVKGLAAADVVEGLGQHIVSGDKERHEEEGEARVERPALAQSGGERSQLIECVDHAEDGECQEDPVQLVPLGLLLLALLLFLGIGCHDSSLNI